MVDHLDDRPHAGALLSDEPRPGVLELELGEALERLPSLSFRRWRRKSCASRRGARAGAGSTRAAGRVGEHEEGVAHRRRAEPLVPGEQVLAVAEPRRDRLVGAHVGAALLLGHRHPQSALSFSAAGRQAGS